MNDYDLAKINLCRYRRPKDCLNRDNAHRSIDRLSTEKTMDCIPTTFNNLRESAGVIYESSLPGISTFWSHCLK